jgi:hypothetical protein
MTRALCQAQFLTRQYVKLLKALVYLKWERYPVCPVIYLISRNIERRKLAQEGWVPVPAPWRVSIDPGRNAWNHAAWNEEKPNEATDTEQPS